jgi:hypothetical protein
MRRRGVEGRRVSVVTPPLRAWLTAWWAAAGKTARLLVWDKASWHVRQAVRAWLKAHNRHVTQAGGCRGVVCPVPRKSPGRNRSAPTWVHGKRAIAEPDRPLNVAALQHRIGAYDAGELLEPIAP